MAVEMISWPNSPQNKVATFSLDIRINNIQLQRTCCNLAGFVPTMDLDETSVEVS